MGKGGNSGVQNFSSCYPSPYLPYPHHLFPWTISVLLVNRWFLVQILQFQIKMLQTCQHFSTFLPPLATHICFANVTRHFQKQKVVGPSFPKISVSFKTSVFSEYLFQSVTRHFQQKVVGPHSLTQNIVQSHAGGLTYKTNKHFIFSRRCKWLRCGQCWRGGEIFRKYANMPR